MNFPPYRAFPASSLFSLKKKRRKNVACSGKLMVYAFQMQKSACNTCGPCIACTLYILYRDVFVHIYMHRYSIRTCNRSRSPVAVARGPWPVARCRGGEDASQPSFMAAKYAIINWAIVAEWEKGQRGRGRGRDGGAKDGFGGCVAPPVCGAHVMSIFVAHFSAYVCVWASVLWGKVYASYFYSISVSPLRLRPLEFPTIFSLGEILRTEFPLDSRRGAGVEAWHLGKKKPEESLSYTHFRGKSIYTRKT